MAPSQILRLASFPSSAAARPAAQGLVKYNLIVLLLLLSASVALRTSSVSMFLTIAEGVLDMEQVVDWVVFWSRTTASMTEGGGRLAPGRETGRYLILSGAV